MKPMAQASVYKCKVALEHIADAMRAESGVQNFDAAIELGSIGRQLYNLTHNGEVVETVPPPSVPPGRG